MDYRTTLGSHALVIGASTTIGEQFARQLAQKGMNVVLVARRQEELERVASDIRREHRVEARVVALDLMVDGAVDKLVEKLRTQKHITIHHEEIPRANHFYENEFEDMMRSVDNYLDMRLSPDCPIK